MTKIPILEGEPQSLLDVAATIKSYTDALIALDRLPEPIREPIKTLVRIVNEAAFVDGVMYERAAIIGDTTGICTIPNHEEGFPDHKCGVVGTCNGYPREHNH